MLAEKYGWTLEYIKTIPVSEMNALFNIISAKNKIEEIKLKGIKHGGK